MRQRLLLLACVLIGAVGAPVVMAQPSAIAGYGDRLVRCESNDGKNRHCAVDTGGGVRMARQLSRSACVEGSSWGVDRGGIWVTQGCRAEFVTGRGGSEPADRGGRGRVVRCESESGRSNLCVMNTRQGVEMVRQLSRSACIREQHWGWNDRGVWVSGGCRGDFQARAGGDNDQQRGPAGVSGSVRCESNDGQRRHCPLDARGGVRLTRQLSRTDCVEGRNWRVGDAGVWVEDGCRADFEAGSRPRLGDR